MQPILQLCVFACAFAIWLDGSRQYFDLMRSLLCRLLLGCFSGIVIGINYRILYGRYSRLKSLQIVLVLVPQLILFMAFSWYGINRISGDCY